MEVDFALCHLLILSISFASQTASVGLGSLSVSCDSCACKSHNGAELPLAKIFNEPMKKVCSGSSYCFPSCLTNNSTQCGNDTSNIVCVTRKSEPIRCLKHVELELVNGSLILDISHTNCSIVISCFQPVVTSTTEVVFNVTKPACQLLRDFVSSAAMNVTPSSTATLNSSSTTVTSFVNVSVTPTLLPTNTSNSSSTINTPSVNVTITSSMSSSATHAPSPSHSPQPPADSGDDNRLLYIVIPTAAPAAFIISFVTMFCLLNCCYQRRKKKLYIKLTPTIYDENQSSDDSDE